MAGEFDSREDSHSIKLQGKPQILVKLRFSELHDSNLSGLRPFDNMAIRLIFKKVKMVGCELIITIIT